MKKIKPVYLIAGGNWRRPGSLLPLFKKILQATGKEKPHVAYIGTANCDDPSFFEFTGDYLTRAGASKVTQIFLADDDADIKSAKSILKKADAVFVSGGDVDEGMYWLDKHRLTPFLRNLHANGVLFFGLSAGSIMLGTHWVRWRNPMDDSSAELFRCMGIAPVLCDAHAEADGWEELKTALMLMGENSKGYGIPTGGVVCVEADGKLSALVKPAVYYRNINGRILKEKVIPLINKPSS
ncbi:MAG: Type 1 glutamine amidotransferase-like domain-containing protein [Spirochaetota bacterium]